ncbi:transposase family protein, partial [Clostridium bowmanii]|uniref:transposase family protein n=1 Tax=Clostridium bowmanii TaxID=132925 RepID=UPI001C0C382A
MNRTERRQDEREHEKEIKRKELESNGVIISRQVYRGKINITNKKCGHSTAEEEKSERQETIEVALKVYRRLLPILLKRLSKIKDPRQTKKTKHSLTVLMIYGILMFVYNISSLRNANKEMSLPIFFNNMNAMFPEFKTMPHSDTLSRLLEKIEVVEIEESLLQLFEELIKKKKFRNHLI